MGAKNATNSGAPSSAVRSAISQSKPVAPRVKPKHQRNRLTRAEVARELDVVKSTIHQLQQRGVLTAERVDGVDYFDRAEVARVAMERASRKRGTPMANNIAGELAARVFNLLNAGTPPAELVTTLKITPDAVIEFVEKYNKLRELEVTRSTAPACAKCNDAPARFCGGCASATRPEPEPPATSKRERS